MTEDEMLKREALAWLMARVQWEDRLDQLRRAAGGATDESTALTTAREVPAVAA